MRSRERCTAGPTAGYNGGNWRIEHERAIPAQGCACPPKTCCLHLASDARSGGPGHRRLRPCWRVAEPLGAATGLLDELLCPLVGDAEHMPDIPDFQALIVQRHGELSRFGCGASLGLLRALALRPQRYQAFG